MRLAILLAVLCAACIDQNWARKRRPHAPGAPNVPSCAEGGIELPRDGGLLCWDAGADEEEE